VAPLVAWRFVQIDDNFVQPIRRIDAAVNSSEEFFIGTGDGKFVAAGERFSGLDDEACEHVLFPVWKLYRQLLRVSSILSLAAYSISP
jgi:hypothetical protein